MRMMVAPSVSDLNAEDLVEYDQEFQEDMEDAEEEDIELKEEFEDDDDVELEDGEDGSNYLEEAEDDDDDDEGDMVKEIQFTIDGDSSDEEGYVDCDVGGYYQTWNPNHVCAVDEDADDVRAALQRRASILIEKLLDVEQPTVTQRMAEYFEQPEVMETLISFITRLQPLDQTSAEVENPEQGPDAGDTNVKTGLVMPASDPALLDSVNRGTVQVQEHRENEDDDNLEELEGEFAKLLKCGPTKVRLNRDRDQTENDALRRAFRATMLIAQPSKPFMRVICLLLPQIVRQLTCMLSPHSDGSLHHYRAIIECLLRDRLLLGALLEALCHPYICSRLLEYVGDPAIASLISSILTKRPESNMAKDWKMKIFDCFSQCKIFDAIGKKIFTSETDEAASESFVAASDLVFDMFESLPWQQGSELVFNELWQGDDFIEELMSASLGKYHPPGTTQHEVYTRMLSKFVSKSRESFINPPSGKGTGFSRGEVVPNGLASLHWRVTQVGVDNIVSMYKILAEKDVPATPKKNLPMPRNYDSSTDTTPEGPQGGKRVSRHKVVKNKATARWLTEDNDRRLSGGVPPQRFSAYTVPKPFTIYRMNILDCIVELVRSTKSGALSHLNEHFWMSLVNWFFEYRHNNLLHKNFYYLLDVCIAEDHEDSLSAILTKCNFVSKAIDFYGEEGTSNRGFIMLCLNILRLKAQTQEAGGLIKAHLETHPGWKEFQSVVIEVTKANNNVLPMVGRVCLPTVGPQKPPPIDIGDWDANSVDLGSVYARLIGFCENPNETPKAPSPYDFEDEDESAGSNTIFRYMRGRSNRRPSNPKSLICEESLNDNESEIEVDKNDDKENNASSEQTHRHISKVSVQANIPRVKYVTEEKDGEGNVEAEVDVLSEASTANNDNISNQKAPAELLAAAASALSALVSEVVAESEGTDKTPARIMAGSAQEEDSWTPQQVIGESLDSRPAYPRPINSAPAARSVAKSVSSPLSSRNDQNLQSLRDGKEPKKRPTSAQDLLQQAEQHLSVDADVEACLAAVIEKENMLPGEDSESSFELLVSKEDQKLAIPRGRRNRYSTNGLKASKTPSPPHGNNRSTLGDRSQTPPPNLRNGRRLGRPSKLSQLTASWLRDDADSDSSASAGEPLPLSMS